MRIIIPVFPSVTRINAASMVTGRYPGGHGLAANTMVARDYDPALGFSALEPTLADIGRKTGRVLLAPTLADILSGPWHGIHGHRGRDFGQRLRSQPERRQVGRRDDPPGLHAALLAPGTPDVEVGEWPAESQPNTPRFQQAIRILTEHIIPEREPAVALIWSSEPDKAQHASGVGSELSDRAIREADAGFGQMMDWLAANGHAETDVMVVSDHGYSTIREVVDVEAHVRDAGLFRTATRWWLPNGGSVLFYVRDARLTASRLAVTSHGSGLVRSSAGVRSGRRDRWHTAYVSGRMRRSEGAGTRSVVCLGLGDQ